MKIHGKHHDMIFCHSSMMISNSVNICSGLQLTDHFYTAGSAGREIICDDERSSSLVSHRENDVELVRWVLDEDRQYTLFPWRAPYIHLAILDFFIHFSCKIVDIHCWVADDEVRGYRDDVEDVFQHLWKTSNILSWHSRQLSWAHFA